MGLGAASVKAQVRIGGNTPPDPAAALDLNAAEGTTTGTKGLALPRVTLGSNTATLDGSTANITGMLVYNTGGNLSAGMYYWDGSEWIMTNGDGNGGNAVMDATVNGGLVKAGSGTSVSPFTLGIGDSSIKSNMIAPASVSLAQTKIRRYALGISIAAPANSTGTVTYPSTCHRNSMWITWYVAGWGSCVVSSYISCIRIGGQPGPTADSVWVYCGD